mmetsp:Transcript_31549/g.86939  ORF Transcript_31549/g.86939 Transcript_31549/m.86939 type:complete len:214 (+) Transcript_31549:432-1073(+)
MGALLRNRGRRLRYSGAFTRRASTAHADRCSQRTGARPTCPSADFKATYLSSSCWLWVRRVECGIQASTLGASDRGNPASGRSCDKGSGLSRPLVANAGGLDALLGQPAVRLYLHLFAGSFHPRGGPRSCALHPAYSKAPAGQARNISHSGASELLAFSFPAEHAEPRVVPQRLRNASPARAWHLESRELCAHRPFIRHRLLHHGSERPTDGP